MKKRIIVSILVLMLVGSTAVSFGTTKSEINNQINEKQEELNQGKAKEEALEGEISDIEARMAQNNVDVKKLAGEVAGLQTSLEEKNKQLDVKKEEIEKGLDGLNKRLRNMYKAGSMGFLDVILSSGNVSELLANFELVKKIYAGDKNIVATLEKEYSKIEEDQKEIEALQATLREKQRTVAEKQNSLIADKETIAVKKNEVSAENNLTEQEIRELQADAAAIDSQINNAISSGGGGSSSGGSSGGGGSSSGGGGSSSGGMIWPMSGTVTQEFGGMFSGWPHRGIDIGAGTGTPIRAAKNGKVILAGWGNSYGNYVVIDHGGGLTTLYAHCSRLNVSAGQSVVQNEIIALCGNTGNSFGSHLHFEVAVYGSLQNPRNYL